MTRTAKNRRLIALALTSALATTALTGCTTHPAPRADVSASKAEIALKKGRAGQAVEHAEAAVLAQPHDAQYRAMLGAAYMEAGRFQSASTALQDAMTLGDNSPRTALSYALAETALGHYAKAQAVLDDWRDDIDPADLGLALALAGRPAEGVQVLGTALRGGENTAKVRQNLAYAFALQGDWRAARVMAAEDVPSDQINDRIAEWASTVKPEAYQSRVAGLLGVEATADQGQPAMLALENNPSVEQLAAEAAAMAPDAASAPAGDDYAYAAPAGELPAVDGDAPAAPQLATVEPEVSQGERFQAAFAAPAPSGATPAQLMQSMVEFVSKPVVQQMPARYGAEAAPRSSSTNNTNGSTSKGFGQSAIAAADHADGSHLVQLGSFSSREGARRAWGIYAKRYPQLGDYRMVITEARVRGKSYFRVSAGGFERADARSLCSTVKSGGEGCITWAEGRPLPGAIDAGVRMASR